jgi:putative ABC transport system permease protein
MSFQAKGLSLPWLEPFFAPALLLGTLLIGILAGVYPAFFLSSFRPVEVLKSRFTAKKGGKFLRSALVVGQFTASIALVIFTIVIQQQMNYVQNKNLGYDREQVLILEDAYTLGEKSESFKNEMLQLPEISEVSMSAFLPTWSSRNNNAHWPKGKRNEESTVIIQNWSVDHDYIPTLGMEIIRGRNFDRKMATDSQAVILNETAVRQLGFTDNPIGQYISTFIDIDDQTGETTEGDYKVIGVIKDFHFSTLRNTISALGLFMRDEPAYYFIFRTETSDLESTLATMEKKWKEFNPGQPFNYSFLDERFDQMYRSVSREGRVFGAFAFLAILVACLGLFALAAYMAETRYKEIGIRKVMGASVSNIVLLLSREFMQLVGIALLLAIPLSWLLASQWLEDFAYRISINAWTFVIAAALAIGIALLTVSYQSFKAAMADPVNALKDE